MGDAKVMNTTIRPLLAGYAIVFGALLAWSSAALLAAETPSQRMSAHDVYFTLKDKSAEAKENLVAGCKKYLADHPGTVWFAAGVIVAEHQRDVNDRNFDVALHIVFKDKASHDKYQDAPQHHKFIEEYEQNWEMVRVFDSWVDVSSHGKVPAKGEKPDQAKKPRLPDAAAFFAGMIQGKVVAKYDGEIAVAVEKVTRTWRASKAENPKALEGKTVLVRGTKEDGHYARLVARFIDSLKVGETVRLDVAHKGKGEALTILELTEEQRVRAD
jgi:hypothetical protein